jgi:hypothetical protein
MASPKEGSFFLAELWRRIINNPATPRWVVAAGAYLLILSVTASHLARPQLFIPEVGRVAVKDYIAPFSTIYEDTTQTKAAQERAAQEVTPVYSIDANIVAGITTDIGNFFLALDDSAAQIEQNSTTGAGPGNGVREGLITAAINSLRRALDADLKIQRYFVEPVTDEDLREFLTMPPSARDLMQDVVDRSVRERIIAVIFEADIPKVLNDLTKSVLEKAGESGLSPTQTRLAEVISAYFIRPNTSQDQAATELARQQARSSTPPVQDVVREGQIFLRKGEVVTQKHLDILKALGLTEPRGQEYVSLAILLFALVLAVSFALGVIFLPGPIPVKLDDLRYYLLLFTIISICYLSSFFLITRLTLASSGPPSAIAMMLSSLPIISGAVLLAHYFNRIAAAVISCSMGIMITLAAGEPTILLPSVMTSLAASLLVKRDATRTQFIRAIIFLPFIWVLSVLSITYTAGLDLSILQKEAWVLLYGLAPAPVAMILANFVLDGAFNVPTANRLREFDTPDHPLLKKLQLEAAGTWHHSMMVGLIAEAACQVLRGKTLLVRVACMYHDIGKLRRPEFFVENQFHGMNVHDKYSPWLSKIIIESHVKDGIAMAQAHGLPEELVEMIPQHHGTSLITYFFRKALAMSEDGYVNEYDYRYPGPKPQSLEAACINLADACESATRTLEEPTPHRIESLVDRIYEERLLDGQYDECGLALNQLDTIKTIIIERLIGAYHARIEYPEEEELRRQLQLKRAEAGEKLPRMESSEREE